MIYGPSGSEIPRLFAEVFAKVFGLDFERYLVREGRGFVALLVTGASVKGELVARCNLDEQSETALITDVDKLGQPNAFGGYFTPSRFQNPPVKHDVLYIAQRWLDRDAKGRVATAFHEACHCYRDSNSFQVSPEVSAALPKARKLRRFTQYPNDDLYGHDDPWYALLVASAGKLQAAYPQLFTTIRDVVVTALTGDLDEQAMMDEAVDLWEDAP